MAQALLLGSGRGDAEMESNAEPKKDSIRREIK